MKILVFGGTRMMGKHLVYALISQGYDITIATRGISSDDFGRNVDRIIVDRNNENDIKAKLVESYDIVFDSLAFSSNDVKILLDNISCKRYIMISTTAVYNKHINTQEWEFNPLDQKVIWCSRPDFPYNEVKKQAERALAQEFPAQNSVAVRFPFVIGEDDYTKRLYFYVEHIIAEKPIFVDNFESQMAFVRSDEAGKFLSVFCENDFVGEINGASEGTISISQIADYVYKKTGKSIVLDEKGDYAPYNGENSYSINTDKAKSLGFSFTPLNEWIYELLDRLIELAINKK